MAAEQHPYTPPWRTCLHCGRRCHVPVSRSMPDHVRLLYEAAGRSEMATCEEGSAAEQRELGVSYADVIEARVREVAKHPMDWSH